jgi:hypothetical protein
MGLIFLLCTTLQAQNATKRKSLYGGPDKTKLISFYRGRFLYANILRSESTIQLFLNNKKLTSAQNFIVSSFSWTPKGELQYWYENGDNRYSAVNGVTKITLPRSKVNNPSTMAWEESGEILHKYTRFNNLKGLSEEYALYESKKLYGPYAKIANYKDLLLFGIGNGSNPQNKTVSGLKKVIILQNTVSKDSILFDRSISTTLNGFYITKSDVGDNYMFIVPNTNEGATLKTSNRLLLSFNGLYDQRPGKDFSTGKTPMLVTNYGSINEQGQICYFTYDGYGFHSWVDDLEIDSLMGIEPVENPYISPKGKISFIGQVNNFIFPIVNNSYKKFSYNKLKLITWNKDHSRYAMAVSNGKTWSILSDGFIHTSNHSDVIQILSLPEKKGFIYVTKKGNNYTISFNKKIVYEGGACGFVNYYKSTLYWVAVINSVHYEMTLKI